MLRPVRVKMIITPLFLLAPPAHGSLCLSLSLSSHPRVQRLWWPCWIMPLTRFVSSLRRSASASSASNCEHNIMRR
ncbi:hypothetical protein EV126DRAFT_413982 [Verticillium dahliae]|nr:hypothetical protein EV126DRAFT_413982 [Verticillium dahliae]